MSLASLFHLAWALVVARATGRDDVVFGTLLFGRMQGGEGAERAMGLFINTLPLRVRVGDQPVQEALREVHALLVRLMRHEHAPLALAQRCSGVAAPAPLFTGLLNFRHSPMDRAAQPDPGGMQLLHAQERTDYPVLLNVDDLGDDLMVTAQVVRAVDPQRVRWWQASWWRWVPHAWAPRA